VRAEQAPVKAELGDAGSLRQGGGIAVGGFEQFELDGVAPEFALELVGGAFGDDAAAVDDREPGGEPVGLLEVVGGE
jgi:hypothetical protein